MKKTKLFGWAFVAYMMGANFSACSNDAEEVLAQESEIRLTSEITPSRVVDLDLQSTKIIEGRKVGVTIYDDQGNLIQSRIVSPASDCVGFDIEAGVWHGLVVLEDDTVLFEIKQGPYAPIVASNIASWTPAADDTVAVEKFIKELEEKFTKL